MVGAGSRKGAKDIKRNEAYYIKIGHKFEKLCLVVVLRD